LIIADGVTEMTAEAQGRSARRGLRCAEEVRRRYIERLPKSEDADVSLLHAIAKEIAESCGLTSLKAHRLAWDWSVTEAVEAFHEMCRRDEVKPRGLVPRSWLEWEAGGRPSWDYQDLLSRLFHANPVQLGWASDYTPLQASPTESEPKPVPRPPAGVANAERHETRWALMHLPPDISDFTGRHEEADFLARLLGDPASGAGTALTVACISGKPGAGKTTLALHVAHRVGDRFPDGRLYVNLRGAEARPVTASDVLAGLLRELGVDVGDIPDRIDDRARMYRARLADRQCLILLDNAADEAQIRDLLPGTPDCAVLVTSRSRLSAVAGIHAIALDVMPPAQARQLLTAIVGVERSRSDPNAISEIASLCGFLPLAIRIAGARLHSRPAWSAAWFARRLRDESRRLDLLRVGDLGVRATFAVSYESRRPGAQKAFCMCAMLPSGFPAWNLAVVLGEECDAAEELLEELVDAQLVEVAGLDATGVVRYGLHDLLRDFAREMLQLAESDRAQASALAALVEEYVLAVRLCSALLQPGAAASSDAPRLIGQLVRNDPKSWIGAERSSLVALVQSAFDAELWTHTWRLAQALPAVLRMRADWPAWELTQQLGLNAAQHLGDRRAEAAMLQNLGVLRRERGYYELAAETLARAASLYRDVGDEAGWASCRCDLGDAYRYQGKLAEAIDTFGDALAVFSDSGDQRGSATALNGIADAFRGLSKWYEAEQRFAECLARYSELGDELEYARSTVRLAMVYRDRALGPQAAQLLEEALLVFRDLGDRRWEARTLRQRGVVYRQDGQIEAAVSLLDAAVAIFEELADWRAVAVTRRNRGDTWRCVGNLGTAAEDLAEALAAFSEIGDQRWTARTRLSLAGVARAENDWPRAAHLVDEALATLTTIGDVPGQARALRELGLLHRERGQLADAQAALERSLAIFSDLGDYIWQARVLAGIASTDRAHGEDPGRRLSKAREICRRSGITDSAMIALALKEW
jgi:tetratricopeptide (TPR) repeat protein